MKIPKRPGDPRQAEAYFASRLAFNVLPADLESLRVETGQLVLVDVRPAAAFNAGHIDGAEHLPPEAWTCAETERDVLHVVYDSGVGSQAAARAGAALAKQGIAVMELTGGYAAWLAAGLAVVTSDGRAGRDQRAARTPAERPERTDGMRQLNHATANFTPAE